MGKKRRIAAGDWNDYERFDLRLDGMDIFERMNSGKTVQL
ncbi:hypothetical protein J2T14_005076 [Paenibacillus harenae]|nr:hypothetical protein [Paenibacillus harenae]